MAEKTISNAWTSLTFKVLASVVLALMLATALRPGVAFADEGLVAQDGGFAAQASTSADLNAMFRLYNPNSGEHFYTSNVTERDNVASVGWNYEGVGWAAPQSLDEPVYRLYNANGGEHHYTTSAEERDNLVGLGWKDEGVGWYSDASKSVALYRLYNPNAFANNHHYTTSADERDNLVGLGWKPEGIGWYGMQLDDSAKASLALKSINGWWQSWGEVGLRWAHFVDGVVYVYRADYSSVFGDSANPENWAAAVISLSYTATVDAVAFKAGSARNAEADGCQIITHRAGQSSPLTFLLFDTNPAALIRQDLDGTRYSGSSSYSRNFNPPETLLAYASQSE